MTKYTYISWEKNSKNKFNKRQQDPWRIPLKVTKSLKRVSKNQVDTHTKKKKKQLMINVHTLMPTARKWKNKLRTISLETSSGKVDQILGNETNSRLKIYEAILPIAVAYILLYKLNLIWLPQLTRHIFINMLQMEYFSAVKFVTGYNKNIELSCDTRISKSLRKNWTGSLITWSY